jgi:hypothetical protein
MNAIWTPEEEANRLAARFSGVNQAKFARENNLPGGASMLSQHIKGRRPLNLEAAKVYARGFHCSISDISPRLAADVLDASHLTLQSGEHLVSALEDWRLQASSRSQAVIDTLTLLAKKNKLRDEDWLLIEQMVQRFAQK